MGLFYASKKARVEKAPAEVEGGEKAPRGARTRKSPGSAPRKTIKVSLQELAAKGCEGCTLNAEVLAHPKMLATGAAHPLIYVLGEAPGREEDEDAVQFVGKGGQLVRRLIPSKWEKKVRWDNIVDCRPPGNREPTPLEVACCRSRQVADIEKAKPQVIIGFGPAPLKWMLGSDRSIMAWRGRRIPVQVGTHAAWFYPIADPDFIRKAENDKKKGQAHRMYFERDLARVFHDLEQGLPEPAPETDFMAGIDWLKEYGDKGVDRIEKELEYAAGLEHSSIDLETNMLRPYSPNSRIATVSVGNYEYNFSFPYHHSDAQFTDKQKARIKTALRRYLLSNGMKWAHNAKFEQEWLLREFGPDILYKVNWGDTMAQAHFLDERGGAKALDDLTQLHFGFRVKELSDVDLSRIMEEPLSKVLPYNALDTKYCYALSVIQADLLEEEGLTELYEEQNAKSASIVRLQAKGLIRNLPAIKTLDVSLREQERKLIDKITRQSDVAKFIAEGGEFNHASPQKLAAFFYDHLKVIPAKRKEGSRSVDEEALLQLKHPVAKMILDVRSAHKMHSTYIVPLMEGNEHAEATRGKHVHDDGMLHPSYSNLVTVTGRLACEDPNAQNFPRRENKEIRRVIGCPKGYKFVSFDYKTLEVAIAACASRDPVLSKDIFDKVDLHGEWTDKIGGQFVPKRVKEDRKGVRDAIKQLWTFSNIYGNHLDAIAYDLSEELEVTIRSRDLEPHYAAFWRKYKALKAWQDKTMEAYWDTGYVESLTGQRRRHPMSRNEIINHPIQGPAGQLVVDAQARIDLLAYETEDPILVPILNVHDDLSFYFPERKVEQYIEIIAREMVLTPFDWVTVPLTVEVAMGDNWADKEEVGSFETREFQ